MDPARSVSRLLRAASLLAVLAGAAQASAQDKPRLRPKPLPEPSDRTIDANSLSDLNTMGAPDLSASPSASPRPTRQGGVVVPPPPPLVLRSAVHSRYSRPATIARSTTGQCRAQCAVDRTQCASGEGDTSGCDPGWTRCLSTCDGLTYYRGP